MTCTRHTSRARRHSANGGGFTLVELLLTVSLILLLAAAAVFNLTPMQRGTRLDEGATQFEALLRYARAQATSSGRTIQVTCDEGGGEFSPGTNLVLHVKWEPDPLGAPGVFEELPETPAYLGAIQDLVNVLRIRLLDDTAPRTNTEEGLESSSTNRVALSKSPEANAPASTGTEETSTSLSDLRSLPPAITFYPDGSSDSAEIVLSSQDEEDSRQIALRLTGLTGSILRQRVPRPGEAVELPEEEPTTELTRAGEPAP